MGLLSKWWLLCAVGLSLLRVSAPCGAAAGFLSYEGADYELVEGATGAVSRGSLVVSNGALACRNIPEGPYVLEFDAQMPRPSRGAPDFGKGQVWFSVDYGTEFDRLAFAVRGGNLQDVLVLSYAQRHLPTPERGKIGTPAHAALASRFRRLPSRIEPDQWFHVRLTVSADVVGLEVDGARVLEYRREMTAGRSFCLGGSWQQNRFKNIAVAAADPSTIALNVEGALPVRRSYHPEALKFDLGGSDVPVAEGWKRVTDATYSAREGVGWTAPTAGSRRRQSEAPESRLQTLVALAHDSRKSALELKLAPGDYLISVGLGDAEYPTSMDLADPAGGRYQADFAAGQWGEVRFAVHHKGDLLRIPFDGSRNNGGSVCYLVAEPLDWARSQKIALSRPAESAGYAERHEGKRAADRAACKPALLPELGDRATLDVSLDGKWLLKPFQEQPGSPTDPAANDDDWHVVDVPSFWNVIGWWLYGSGERHASNGFLYEELRRCEAQTFDWRGTRTAFYRKWLNVPADWAGRRVTVDFQAVASACVVYCNGVEVGRNAGMFKPFTVELTRHIKPGQLNLLALWVNNGIADDAAVESVTQVGVAVTVPITSDMLKGIPRAIYLSPAGDDGKVAADRQGGIWQSVNLHVCRDVRLDDVWPRTGLDRLDLEISAEGPESSFRDLAVRVRVTDGRGRKLASADAPWTPDRKDGSVRTMAVSMTGLAPKLWSPGTPNLYDLSVEIVRGGEVLDSQTCKIGFRTFEIDGERFRLNGKPYRWLGANMAPHGLKPNDRALARKFTELMKEGNQNATRTVCSPYPEIWLDEADRQGIAVSLEGTWSWMMAFDSEVPSDANLDVWKAEWYELIKRLRKHPSIVMWTINNEMYPLHDSSLERRTRKWNILQSVLDDMSKLDPTRPVVLWSGYIRRQQEEKLNEIQDAGIVGRNDGDMDDLHIYSGTYGPSAIGRRQWVTEQIEAVMTPGRPMICQEAGTPYPNADTGHQERAYIKMWHGQIWNGNDTYEHRNPMSFLNRSARVTGEQVEAMRRMRVAGWLAFSNATWYADVQDAAAISPYPIHESVRRALAPVLVALNMPVRQFFAGARIEPKVFVINDDLEARDLTDITLSVRVVSDRGALLSESRARFPAVPASEMREIPVRVDLPKKLSSARSLAYLELELKDRTGALVASNRYELVLCTEDYVRCQKPVTLGISGDEPDSGLVAVLRRAGVRFERGANESARRVTLASGTSGAAWDEIISLAQAGETVLVHEPADLSGLDVLGKVNIADVPLDGECANVVNDRTSPLLDGMLNSDLAWWYDPTGPPGVYRKALVFDADLPDAVEALVDHIRHHDYHSEWRVQFPLVRVRVGEGSIVLSTLNLSGAQDDPLAARFLANLLSYLANED